MRRSAGLSACLVTAACVLAMAGCGSSSTSSGGGGAEEKKPAADVLDDAKSALFNAKSVHVAGSITAEDGTAEKLDFDFQGESSRGTLTVNDIKVQLVKTQGSLYINAPAAFWSKTAGAKASGLADKWVSVSAAQAGDVSDLTLQGIAASLNAEDSPLDPTVKTETVDGKRALLLTQQDGSTLAVEDSTTPRPIKITNKGKSKGEVGFSDYDKSLTISAPPGAVPASQAASSGTTGT